MTRSKWKGNYVNASLLKEVLNNNGKKPIYTKSRSSTILPLFVGLTIYIHNGLSYNKLTIKSTMVGNKLGSFSLTKKRCIFKNKKRKKKK